MATASDSPAGLLSDFWIDVGGTFTDCVARATDDSLHTHKLLSTGVYQGCLGSGPTRAHFCDPQRTGNPPEFFAGWRMRMFAPGQAEPVDEAEVAAFDAAGGRFTFNHPLTVQPAAGWRYELRCDDEAPVIGIRWLLGKRLNEPVGPIRVRLGTTRGTNALLERRGAMTALVTTAGFGDILAIGSQQRPHLFDLAIRKPAPLYREVIELDERVSADGGILRALDERDARQRLTEAHARGVEALAVCLLNSYRNAVHEQRVAALAREIGFAHASISTALSPLQRIVWRGETTVINAYLTPVIGRYLASLRAALPEASLKLMTSAGGLVDADSFVAKDSILSGPAAGVVGAAHVARAAGIKRVIGFDMGGTSTDVSRYDGRFEHRHEMELHDRESGGSIRLSAPMLAIETVAAGGGSICDFDGIKPIVGPRSGGADPGPACYGRGGPLCLTDVNLFLGRVTPDMFPFPLDRDAVRRRLNELVTRIHAATNRRYTPYDLAAGYVAIANTHMAAAIKRASVQKGYDPRDHALVSFGGAGGQHACAVARELGITRILCHAHAGVLSAYGIGMADICRFAEFDVGRPLDDAALNAIEPRFTALEADLRQQVERDGVADADIRPARRMLDLRYAGQDTAISIDGPQDGDWRAAFERGHEQLYGFVHADREVEIHAARLEVAGTTSQGVPASLPTIPASATPAALRRDDAYFAGTHHETPVYDRAALPGGVVITGPAIILEKTGTIVVEPGWQAEHASRGDILLTAQPDRTTAVPRVNRGATAPGSNCDPITLELFNNRFAAICEQMGATLQRTALSTNVKERLDFSCAVYDSTGDLVAHAAHIPVHIGAMGHCVKDMLDETGGRCRPGEVYITNDPYRGGSHLPDVTVITPAFDEYARQVMFYVATRAHHAEIGGIAAGSMSPAGHRLSEEGVCIPLMPLVVQGATQDSRPAGDVRFDEARLRDVFVTAEHPSRAFDQNLADIRAQIAANRCGVGLLRDMARQQGRELVSEYMRHIQRAAETKMRAAIERLPDGQCRFTDYLDDATPIVVTISIGGGTARVDFTGTSAVHRGNLNATPAIVSSAVLYCFRCLIDEDIPLNAGVLNPLEVIIPPGLLNPPRADDPAHCPAVAGGNVETSQRIVDCTFGALGIVAASQGTMNNLTFGDDKFGYYETIAGGTGAGPGFHGADAVHSHMTNTRLTDPEVLEHRYPVRLRSFSIRRGSGGDGKYHGGNGVTREIEFLKPLDVTLLTQRRTRPPYGVAGGSPGGCGKNVLIAANAPPSDLGPVAQLRVAAGDILRIETPGGGGYGRPA